MSYQLEGHMLEVCSCESLCPCFVNRVPDGGACDVTVAWHIDKGEVEGVDVTDRTIAVMAHLPGKPWDGGWRAAVYLDDGTSDAQQEALLNVFTGQLGGPIADVAKLIGDVVGVERAAIEFNADNGAGSLKIADVVDASIKPLVTKDGQVATLLNPLFSGSPGSPARMGTAPHFQAKHPGVGIDLNLVDHSAAECGFTFQG